ncbi:MAG: cytochrome c oxidase assembly protein [Candidatus Nanopelagicales bacterium]
MGARQITPSQLLAKTIPAIIISNLALISTLIFLTTQARSEFLPQAGILVTYSIGIGKFSSYLLGLITLALILRNGILQGFEPKKSKYLPSLAAAWSFSAFVTSFFLIANALSIDFSQAANIQILVTYGWDIATSRAYLFMAMISLFIAVFSLSPKRSTPIATSFFSLIALTLPAANSHAGGVESHQWAVLSGSIHGFSVSLWIASLIALALTQDKLFAFPNFQKLVNFAFWALLFSGLISSSIRLNDFSELLTTLYGQLLTLKLILFLFALSLTKFARKNISNTTYLLWIEITLLTFIFSIASVLSSTDYPKVSPPAFSLFESVTGYPEPPAYELTFALTTFEIEPTILLVGIFAIALYLKGVRTLTLRGDSWPINRTILWISGVVLAVYVTNSYLGRYALVLFSVHMVVHMILAMTVPILLPLAAPITLALRALPATTKSTITLREAIGLFLASRFSKIVTHPIIAFLLFATSTWMLYFSPLLTSLMASHLGHLFMDLHFILVGYVFFWTIIGKDPNHYKVSDPIRLGLVFLAAVFHGFFGFIVSSAENPLGGGWFFQVAPAWLADPVADQQLGGAIAWGFGEIPTVIVLIILLYQWAKRDEKVAKRFTQADTDAYNEYLAKLNKQN